MSTAVKAAMLATRDLPKNEGRVLLAIAAHANRAGDAWPSVATIAEYAGCSKRTVQRCIPKLIQLGRLAVTKVAGIATRVYRLVVDAVTSAVKPTPDSGVDEAAERVDAKATPDPARDRPRWIPKSQTRSYPERRGAALPPPSGAGQCPRHRGCPAGNCGPCRSEALVGGVR